jgi:hypothetical protein
LAVTVSQHDRGCHYAQGPFGEHEDAAKRVSDGYNLHLLADREGNRGYWLAFRIDDGTGDNTCYAIRQDAIDHQLDEKYCMFVPIRARSMTVCEAATLLRTARMLYKLGNKPDDMGGRVIIPRLTNEHAARQMRQLELALQRRN